MRFDFETHTAVIGIRDLAGPEATRWDIPWLPARAALGRELHSHRRRLLESQRPGYKGEVSLSTVVPVRDWQVTLQGRADGVYEADGLTIVEELKSVALEPAELGRLSSWDFPAARFQLSCYCVLLTRQGRVGIRGELVLVSIYESASEFMIPIEYQESEILAALVTRISELLDVQEGLEAWRKVRAQAAASLQFPFPALRPVQSQMLEELQEVLQKGGQLLIEAPTGTGKTAVALYAALKYAWMYGQKLFFVTAKTSGQTAALQTLRLIRAQNLPLRVLLLTARDKICPHPVVFCHPDYCPHANGFYQRLSSSGVRERLLAQGVVDRTLLEKTAAELVLCPFELSLELISSVDVVVCDYNYVFDPSTSLKRIFFDKSYKDWLLIVDEAHQLVPRSRDYYSPIVSWRAIRLLESYGEQRSDLIGTRIRQLAHDLMEAMWQDLEHADLTQAPQGRAEFSPDLKRLGRFQWILERLLMDDPLRRAALASPGREDVLLAFYRQITSFVDVAQHLDSASTALIEREGDEARWRILCHDASRHLRRRLEGFGAVVGMSATLSPGGFYRDLLGFDATTPVAAFPSPFPPERRRILIVHDFPDRYADRPRALPLLTGLVRDLIETRPGCYALFLPSLEVVAQVRGFLERLDCELLVQDPRMDDTLKQALMRRLAEPLGGRGGYRGFASRLLIAVQGGSFAEGVEWPEGVLRGVMVVSPGLPKVSPDQEMHKEYYEETFGDGFSYAYVFPGMSRVIQAAGRLIRREEDRGVIVLVGRRFAEPRYLELLPRHFYEHSPTELMTHSLREALEVFWQAQEGL